MRFFALFNKTSSYKIHKKKHTYVAENCVEGSSAWCGHQFTCYCNICDIFIARLVVILYRLIKVGSKI